MSRLPHHPNIEHLRKQAKALLPVMQRSDPAARLADAQHAIAREYGFANWSTLKAHIESKRTTSPFRGEWIANREKSRRRSDTRSHVARICIAVDGDVLAITHWSMDESGREHRDEQIVHVDGISYALNNGYAMTTSWRGSYGLESVATRNGVEVGRNHYEVAPDGSTLTITNAEGAIVLDRGET